MDKLVDLFTFEGRANRSWYFWHVFLDDLAMVTLIVALVLIGSVLGDPLGLLVVPALVSVVAGGFWAAIAVTVKRLHDLERPGWHWWLLVIPLYNIVLGLVLVFKRGTIGPNTFGPDPLMVSRSGYLPR